MKKIIFLFIFIFFVAGCVKPLEVSPQTQVIDNLVFNLEIVRDVKWYNLSQDVLVMNLEIINNSSEGVWVYPLSKSVIIDARGRQYSPIREIYYQPTNVPKLSFEFTFKSNEPPSFSVVFKSDDKKEKELLDLIKTYELLKFKDGKVFQGARVSGILLFYVPNISFPAKFVIPEVFWEDSLKKYNIEFILIK